ncbi:hypothetical protein QWZ14_12145, partial [Paeniroseomonas aquatica]
ASRSSRVTPPHLLEPFASPRDLMPYNVKALPMSEDSESIQQQHSAHQEDNIAKSETADLDYGALGENKNELVAAQ